MMMMMMMKSRKWKVAEKNLVRLSYESLHSLYLYHDAKNIQYILIYINYFKNRANEIFQRVKDMWEILRCRRNCALLPSSIMVFMMKVIAFSFILFFLINTDKSRASIMSYLMLMEFELVVYVPITSVLLTMDWMAKQWIQHKIFANEKSRNYQAKF